MNTIMKTDSPKRIGMRRMIRRMMYLSTVDVALAGALEAGRRSPSATPPMLNVPGGAGGSHGDEERWVGPD
jgi:hypothetical protein